MKNLEQTNEFQVEKLEARLEMTSWDDGTCVPTPGNITCEF